jgi:glyoxylase-like metal-dependent hydrolase (beta-lactamase superfamily II)
MTWSLTVLPYATQEVPGAQVFNQTRWEERRTFAFYVFLLRRPGTVALIDCGMDAPGPLNAAIEDALGPGGLITPLPSGGLLTGILAAHGVSPGDVDLVALTHLHADHVGNAALFPNARFALSETGWRAHLHLAERQPALVPPAAFPPGAREHLRRAEADGRLLLTDDGELLPGLHARHLGGHTHDSTGYVVETGAGRAVVPGDVVWTFDNIATGVPVGSHVDAAECHAALEWVREAGDHVLPSHDPLTLVRWEAAVGGRP